jgi:two-component system chemotaxis response regulator CheB
VHNFAVIVIGASAGGVVALQSLARQLPQSIPAAIMIVQHIGRHESILPFLLSQAGRLPARHPLNGDPILPGEILLAPPDHHLTGKDGGVCLSRGPRENWARPAIDPLFRSAATAYGRRTIGVILTGTLDDGAAGLYDIRSAGGIAVVQDPDDAEYPALPSAALERAGADYLVRIKDLGEVLDSLAISVASRPKIATELEANRSIDHA